MDANSKRQERRENTLSLLNVAIDALNLVKEAASVAPAKAAFGSVSIILSMIRVRISLVSDGIPQVHVSSGLDG